MIELSSDKWNNLSHAYGSAGDIPEYLQAVYDDPVSESNYNEDPWFHLWSALYHQGTIYSASLAASPHIITAALQAIEKKQLFNWECMALPIDIEKSRQKLRLDANENYFLHFEKINDIVDFSTSFKLSKEMSETILDAKKVLKGLGLLRIKKKSIKIEDGLF